MSQASAQADDPAPSEPLRILLAQHKEASEEIRVVLKSYNAMFGLGMAALVGLYVYGLKESANLVVMFHPVLLFAFLFYMLDMMYGIMVLGGYRRHIEQKLNALAGGPVAFWEDVARSVLHRRNFSMVTVQGIFLVFLAVSCVKGVQAAEARGLLWAMGLGGFLGLLTILAIWAGTRAATAHEETVRFCENYPDSKLVPGRAFQRPRSPEAVSPPHGMRPHP